MGLCLNVTWILKPSQNCILFITMCSINICQMNKCTYKIPFYDQIQNIIYILLFKRLVSHILKYVIPSSFLKSSISKCHVPCAQACLILCDPRGYNLTIRSSRQEYFANFLLQGIFPTQGSNPHLLCLLHHRQIP